VNQTAGISAITIAATIAHAGTVEERPRCGC
jgi:hypothetical protein